MSKKVIGQEVFHERIGAVAVPAPRPHPSRYVVDLRQLSDRVAPRERRDLVPGASSHQEPPRNRSLLAQNQPEPAPPAPQAKPRSIIRRAAPHAARAAILLIGAAFFLSLGISLPERLIGIYFVATLIYAIDSQRTFLIALIFLVMVAIWSALGNSTSAEQFAIYAFYFLVIGLVSAIREMVFSHPQPVESAPSES